MKSGKQKGGMVLGPQERGGKRKGHNAQKRFSTFESNTKNARESPKQKGGVFFGGERPLRKQEKRKKQSCRKKRKVCPSERKGQEFL